MTALDTNAPTIDDAKAALREHAARINLDPRTNSVFAYAQDLFRSLESGALSLADLSATSQSVYGALIVGRADRFRRQHQTETDLKARLQAIAADGWDAFKS
ncbi:MAG: hypothetical protein AAF767_08700, partial [Pseudomonadota bacterium]